MSNIRVKTYPDGTQNILLCNDDLWNADRAPPPPAPPGRIITPAMRAHKDAGNRARAVRRARVAMRDICLCSGMTHFVTLTMDKGKIDRYDQEEVVKKTCKWLDNHVHRGGLITYAVVPEHHQDGAIHFHGLLRLGTIKPEDSGTISGIYKKPARPRSDQQRQEWLDRGGHIVYNLPAWGYGFSTAIALYGEYNAAVNYTCKYIGKEGVKIGGRWYYSGGEVRKPQVDYSTAPSSLFVEMKDAENVKFLDILPAGLQFLELS